jgi:hypothetical protein
MDRQGRFSLSAVQDERRVLRTITTLPGFAFEETTVVLIGILVVANLPVYLFLGWLAFDSKDNAADTFFETVVAILKMILVPDIVRVLLDMDTSGSWGLLPIAGFFLACAGVVYGEYLLLGQWFGLS